MTSCWWRPSSKVLKVREEVLYRLRKRKDNHLLLSRKASFKMQLISSRVSAVAAMLGGIAVASALPVAHDNHLATRQTQPEQQTCAYFAAMQNTDLYSFCQRAGAFQPVADKQGTLCNMGDLVGCTTQCCVATTVPDGTGAPQIFPPAPGSDTLTPVVPTQSAAVPTSTDATMATPTATSIASTPMTTTTDVPSDAAWPTCDQWAASVGGRDVYCYEYNEANAQTKCNPLFFQCEFICCLVLNAY